MQSVFDALARRDKAAVLAAFAEDAVLFDPHYPKPEMKGQAEISAGLDWGLSGMKSFGFRIVNFFTSDEGKAAFEVDTFHVLKIGVKLNFPQVFITEMKDGKFTAMRAYEPYGPNGMGAVFLGASRLKRRLFG
jgi:ketosteroid isomerase-like protein